MLDKNDKIISKEVRIENTNACNAQCIPCPREKLTRSICTMNNQFFQGIILEAWELGANLISIFGFGEPLLDPGIAKKIEMCSELGLNTFVTTNASLLDVNMATDLLDAGLDHLRISIHGVTKEDYEHVQKGLNWEILNRNIQNFISKNRIRSHGCRVSITAMPIMREDPQKIRDMWEKHVDWLEIWRPHNWVYGREYRTYHLKKRTCGRPRRGPIQVNADGKVMVCCFDFDAKMTIGNMNADSLIDILKNDKLRKIKIAHETGNVEGLPCEYCDQLNQEPTQPLLYSNRRENVWGGETSSSLFKLEDDKS